MDSNLLQAITDGSDEAVCVVDSSLNIVYVNGRFCFVCDVVRDAIVGLPLASIDCISDVDARIRKDLHERREFPSRTSFNLAKGIPRLGEGTKVTLDYINMSGTTYVIVRIAETIDNLSDGFSPSIDPGWILECLIDGVAIVDTRGYLIYINDAFCEILGRVREEIIGKRWIDFTLHPDDDIVYEKIALRRAGEIERYEIEWVRADGTKIPTCVSAAPFYDKFGNFIGSVSVLTDISSLKEHENALKFYIGLLTHDIPNQLQVVMTAAGLLDENLPASYISDARVTITEALERCNRLIVKVKRAAKMRDLPIREINITQVLHEKIRAVERVYQATVHVDNFEEPIYVMANSLLGELIWNLLENAARHNPKADRHIWVSCSRNDTMFLLYIEDNGPGISDEKKTILFDKSKRTGGVGLTLVAHMVHECGGTINVLDRVQGHPDQGSKFILSLPLAE